MAVKDGKLLGGPPGRGSFAGYRTRFSQKAQTRPFCHRIGRALPGRSRLRKSTLCHALAALQWRTEGWRRNLPRSALPFRLSPLAGLCFFEGAICPAVPWPCRFGVAKRTCLSPVAGLWTLLFQRRQMGHLEALPAAMLLRRGERCFFKGAICPAVPCRLALWLAFEPCSICVSQAATPSERESTLRHALTAWQLRTAARRAARSWPICRLWNAYKTKFKGEPKVKNVRWATQKWQGTAGQIAPSKKQSPRLNSMAVKDGKLLRGPPGCGPFACEALIEQGLKASQRA